MKQEAISSAESKKLLKNKNQILNNKINFLEQANLFNEKESKDVNK
jgi:hypothetical protein